MSCISGKQSVYYRDDFQCVIENGEDRSIIGYNKTVNDLGNIINENTIKENPALKYYYSKQYLSPSDRTPHIYLPPLKEYNTTIDDCDIYVNNSKEDEHCTLIDNLDNSVIVLVIVLPSFYFLVTICMIVFYCKYKRIRSQYQVLRSEVDATSNSHTSPVNEDVIV
jgi:hypothetical protein